LPQFYNPEDYLAIFSTLPTLNKGDLIEINYDGISYEYEVEDMFEVLPTDIQVLEQNSGDSFLTLVTCVPPGHPLKPKRLIVRARILPLGQANANIRN
jgi:sortase A